MRTSILVGSTLAGAFALLSACVIARSGLRGDGQTQDGDGDVDADGDGDVDAESDGDADSDADEDMCVPYAELCNGVDDDCDGAIDEDFDLEGDPTNCGACGHPCPVDPPHGTSSCEEGECALECNAGWADCTDADGCETSLASPEDCGACGHRCEGATPLCAPADSGGFDCVSSCDAPEVNCDGSCTDTATDPDNCGSCGNACDEPPHARPTCVGGGCGFECDPGWHDCGGGATDGCESDLRTLIDCGACGVPCELPHATETCESGTCEIVACEGLFRDCDAGAGCETLATTLEDCGGCGDICELPHATETCATGTCEIVRCDDGWGDCAAAPGCETDLSDEATCGDCATPCIADESCVDGECVSAECPPACTCAADCDPSCSCASGCPCRDFWCDGDCDITCSGLGTLCEVDAAEASNVVVNCNGGAECDIDFFEGSNMYDPPAVCSGTGTVCRFNCESASHCEVNCNGGAYCILQCLDAADCSFSECHASSAVGCAGDVIVCGGPCP